jgi:hypothetical protein
LDAFVDEVLAQLTAMETDGTSPQPRSSFRREVWRCWDQASSQLSVIAISSPLPTRVGWQRDTDYGRRPMAETAMSKYKRILGDHLHAC